MNGVTIFDDDCELKDIIDVLGDDAIRSTWTLTGIECFGEQAAADALHHASDTQETIDGQRLAVLALEIRQVIDGEFYARAAGDADSWGSIRAVDGFAFEVETEREDVLERIRARFARVEDLP